MRLDDRWVALAGFGPRDIAAEASRVDEVLYGYSELPDPLTFPDAPAATPTGTRQNEPALANVDTGSIQYVAGVAP